jgi:hypothetical protein
MANIPGARRWLFIGAAALAAPMLAAAANQTPSIGAERWREDLRYVARELPKRHKNAYHSTSQDAFARAVAALDADIPSLQDHQIIVRLQQLAASVGDGHTRVQIPLTFKRYPINMYWFGRELRVVAATKEYEAALGARVVKIGGVAIDEVDAKIRTCFPSVENENEWYALSASPAFMSRPEFLHTLGIVPDVAKAAFTFEDDQGRELTLDIVPVTLPAPVNGVVNLGLLPAVKETPLYRQKLGEAFWFTHLPEADTVYVNFKRYTSLGDNAKPLFALLDSHPTSRLVIDLRQNGGGDFFVGRKHLIEPIKKRPGINQKGRLFVIIGRATFSAALANAVDFRKETNAILVGEPIGERPNSYSENDEMTLPNSRLVMSYSTRYYKFVDEDVPAVLPDKRIDPAWADYRTGRDAVMDWILAGGR